MELLVTPPKLVGFTAFQLLFVKTPPPKTQLFVPCKCKPHSYYMETPYIRINTVGLMVALIMGYFQI